MNYDVSCESIKNSYDDIIKSLTNNNSKWFANLQLHLVFKNINILDCSWWPSEKENLSSYGESEMNELVGHFSKLLTKNGCDIDKSIPEWDLLKVKVTSVFSGYKKKYLEVGRRHLIPTTKIHGKFHIILSRPLHHPLQNFFSFGPWLDTLKLERNSKFQRLGSSGTLLFQSFRIGPLDQKMTATMRKWGLPYVS